VPRVTDGRRERDEGPCWRVRANGLGWSRERTSRFFATPHSPDTGLPDSGTPDTGLTGYIFRVAQAWVFAGTFTPRRSHVRERTPGRTERGNVPLWEVRTQAGEGLRGTGRAARMTWRHVIRSAHRGRPPDSRPYLTLPHLTPVTTAVQPRAQAASRCRQPGARRAQTDLQFV